MIDSPAFSFYWLNAGLFLYVEFSELRDGAIAQI